MLDDIKKFIESCEVCQKNHKTRFLNHPVLASKVLEIFYKIGIDCVFGLPTTTDGYLGLLVISEHLTKFIWVNTRKATRFFDDFKQFFSL